MRPVFQTMLASSLMIALSGAAQAEITLSGDARMGVVQDLFSDEVSFTSRARVRFDMTGETDGGLSFGARVLMNEAGLAVPDDFRPWVAGRVYISGEFGMLSMGDTDSAAEAAVGSVSAVSLTGLGDNHETTFYQSTVGAAYGPSVLYEYYGSGWAVFASATSSRDVFSFPYFGSSKNLSIGGRYTVSGLTLALGAERESYDGSVTLQNIVASASYEFGEFTAKAVYGQIDQVSFGFPTTVSRRNPHYYLSLDWERGPWVVAAFYARQPDTSAFFQNSTYYGVGAAYDLGGGAAVTGGVVREEYPGANAGGATAFDFGVTMSF